ncbi:uncharacterized protein MELLADRAFT_70896 [Melampsora larici-populina 98AG31]|uniref:Uncharacterized protein n=1 Tax=Melampsora larici-populina (strain 98AG31 / pathotype 3-4-7) TaxID=747676 RepID=F4R983_MELLP|nr:uncharacterized protein MELLADRAFT_70896 [Melampsora larici-populina 98AG31]EGG11198.1 hypothetical protein MELLADRAFT_70896 [Melampsora larici-populina 98AG31]
MAVAGSVVRMIPVTASGVCLWSGTSWVNGADPQTAGWLNWAGNGNCGKQIYIQRQNQPETMQIAPVLDGCNFGPSGRMLPDMDDKG